MDPTSSLRSICLGENICGSSSEKVEGYGDWNAPEYTDTTGSKEKKVTKALNFYKMGMDEKENKVVKKEFIVALKGEIYFFKFIINPKEDDVEPRVIFRRPFMRLVNGIVDFGSGISIDDIPQLGGEELPLFICKMGKSSRNRKTTMENLNLFYPDIGPYSSTRRHLTQVEATKEALALRISQKFALLEEMKVELDGMIMKEEEEAINKVKGEALKEKYDPGAFIFPIRFEGKINENALADTGSDINTMPYRIYEKLRREEIKKDIPIDRDAPIVVGQGFIYTIRGIVNTIERLFLTFDGIFHQTFCATLSDVLRTAESDSDDEEEYEIKRNKFGAPIYGLKSAAYLNCNDPSERSLALQAVINPFRKISTMGGNNDEVGSSRSKRSRQYKTVEEIRAFNISEPIYLELCHEFYSTYEFDEVRTDDEFQTKKIIKFRLGGRAHSLTLLEFARRLGLYYVGELDEEGFNEHFNAQEYWLSINQEENLSLSRSQASTTWTRFIHITLSGIVTRKEDLNWGLGSRIIRSEISTGCFDPLSHEYDKIQKNDLWLLSMFDARHQNGYANAAWLITRWMKRKGVGTQKESQICCVQFITKLARKVRVLSDEVLRSLSALICCRNLDTITLSELIDFEGRLILEDPQTGIPRVYIPRPLRASM
ncbi:hypothetical protein Tco_0559430 [Tanacetum coccineum]